MENTDILAKCDMPIERLNRHERDMLLAFLLYTMDGEQRNQFRRAYGDLHRRLYGS